MENRTFTVVLHQEEDMFVAECPEVGTVSQGKSIEESINNLREATELYLEEFPIKEGSKPIVSFFEVKSNAKSEKGV
jgi:predicted RNase H-like HicB family nuclease